MRKFGLFIVLLSFVLIFSGSPVLAEEEVRYLQNNIHYQERPDRGGKLVRRASYANYTDPGEGHRVLPVNTKVEIKVKQGWRGKGIKITDLSDGKLIDFEYNKRKNSLRLNPMLHLLSNCLYP